MKSYYLPYTDFINKISSSIPKHWETKRGKAVFNSIDERSEEGKEMLLSVSEHRGVVPRKELKITMFMAESYEGFKLCDVGDVVVNSLWAWGRGIGVSEHRGIISTAYGVFRLKDKTKFNHRYLNYLLRTKDYCALYLMRSKGIWISRLQLLDKNFLDLPIVCPPVKEQNKIVEFLDSQSEKINRFIKKKQRFIELLKEQRQSIISQTITKGIDANVKMKVSGIDWLGEVPKHWEIRKLKFSVSLNANEIDAETLSEDVFKIALENIDNWTGRFIETGNPQFDGEGKRFKTGDVLFNKLRPYLAKAFIADREGFCVGELLVLTPIEEVITKEFLFQRLMTSEFIEIVNGSTYGAKMPRANWDFIGNIKIGIPPIAEQQKIITHIKTETQTIDTAITKAEKEIELIKEYKEAMIAEAVMGKMKI